MEKVYGTVEAAKYVGLSRVGLQWHVYQTKLLKGQLIGKTLVFTKAELDAFMEREGKRKRGKDDTPTED
jgi:hypothetical protein